METCILVTRRSRGMQDPARTCQVADDKPDRRAAHHRPPQNDPKVQLPGLRTTPHGKVVSR